MEVDGALVVCLGDIFRQQDAAGQIPAHLTGDVIPLGGGDHGVLIGVLLGQLLVLVAQQGEDGLIGGVLLAHQSPGVAVDDVGLGQIELILIHQALLHQVLDLLHRQLVPAQVLNAADNGLDAVLTQPLLLGDLGVGLLDGSNDLIAVVLHNGAVTLDHFHVGTHGRSPSLS